MKKPVIKIHYSLLLVLIVSCFSGAFYNAIGMLLILFLHELGHIFLLYKFGGSLQKISFSLIGGMMDIDTSHISPLRRSLIFR